MRLKILKNAIMIVVIFSTPSFSLSMKIQQNCGKPYSNFQIDIESPPGGHVNVNSDGSINFPATVKLGTKLMVVLSSDVCGFSQDCYNQIISSWTPAQDNGILPVKCSSPS